MNTIIILSVSFLIVSYIQTTFSYPSSKVGTHKTVPGSMTRKISELMSLDSQEDLVQERSWDSGEDHYFRWATNNRRPMESLVGKKREQSRPLIRSDDRRINNGLWRSGLVG